MAFETPSPYSDSSEDHQRALEQSGQQYIRELVSNNGPALYEAFDIQNSSDGRDEAELLRRTANALDMLDVEATIGLVLRHVGRAEEPGRHEPLAKLGWAVLEPYEGAAGGYVVRPTEPGLMVLDGLRAASGQPTAAQERARHLMAYHAQVAAIKARRLTAPSA